MLGFACEHAFGLMELWIQVLFIRFNFVWGLSMVMVLGFTLVPLRVLLFQFLKGAHGAKF